MKIYLFIVIDERTMNVSEGVDNISSRSLAENISRSDERLTGIFLVSFDTKQGNIVEWSMPSGLDLSMIEYKAMANGFHLVDRDFV